MLLKLRELADDDALALMDIYQESTKDNVSVFFPEVKDMKKGFELAKAAYISYIRNDFLQKDNTLYYVFEDNGVWVSAMRLYQIQNNLYFIEALETHPMYRKQGYAEKLIKNVIDELKSNSNFEIQSYTGLTNIASRTIHKKCRFEEILGEAFDYATQDFVENVAAFSYRYPLEKSLPK